MEAARAGPATWLEHVFLASRSQPRFDLPGKRAAGCATGSSSNGGLRRGGSGLASCQAALVPAYEPVSRRGPGRARPCRPRPVARAARPEARGTRPGVLWRRRVGQAGGRPDPLTGLFARSGRTHASGWRPPQRGRSLSSPASRSAPTGPAGRPGGGASRPPRRRASRTALGVRARAWRRRQPRKARHRSDTFRVTPVSEDRTGIAAVAPALRKTRRYRTSAAPVFLALALLYPGAWLALRRPWRSRRSLLCQTRGWEGIDPSSSA